jgi:hypothetical protein
MTWPMNAAARSRPHVAVEGALGKVAADLDFGVEVDLADDAAFALGDVDGPPGLVEVVQGDSAVLDAPAAPRPLEGPVDQPSFSQRLVQQDGHEHDDVADK